LGWRLDRLKAKDENELLMYDLVWYLYSFWTKRKTSKVGMLQGKIALETYIRKIMF